MLGDMVVPRLTPVTCELVSLPVSCLQAVEGEDGLAQLLQQMGVQNGQNISFNNFWTLINNQAVQLFGSMHKAKNVKCGCLLQ